MDSPCGDKSCGETTNIVVVRGPFLWPFRCFLSTTFGRYHATHDPNEWRAFASVAVLVFWVLGLALLCGLLAVSGLLCSLACPASRPTKQGLLRSAIPPLTSHAHTHTNHAYTIHRHAAARRPS